MKFGLSNEIMGQINEVFSHFPQVEKALIYGSRAIGTNRPGSDLDLALLGTVDLEALNRVRNELDDLNLPYTFDVSIYNQIDNPDLIDHIKRVGAIFFESRRPDLNR